jgi:hypothetical protein
VLVHRAGYLTLVREGINPAYNMHRPITGSNLDPWGPFSAHFKTRTELHKPRYVNQAFTQV